MLIRKPVTLHVIFIIGRVLESSYRVNRVVPVHGCGVKELIRHTGAQGLTSELKLCKLNSEIR